MQPDLQALALTKAIMKKESGGNYNAVGDAGTSSGAFQFQKSTWQRYAKEVLGDANAAMTPENQNAVAYAKIKMWKDAGWGPAQIAAAWNTGEGRAQNGEWTKMVSTGKGGTLPPAVINGQKIEFDTPTYVKDVIDNFKAIYPEVSAKYSQLVPANSNDGGITNPTDPANIEMPQAQTTAQTGVLAPKQDTTPLGLGAKVVDSVFNTNISDVVTDFNTGVKQGAIKTAKGIQNLGNKILSPFKKALGIDGVQTGVAALDSSTDQGKILDSQLVPQNKAQATGQIAESIVEFLAPSSGVTKVQTALGGAIKGTGKLTNLARLGVKATTEAGIGASQAYIKEGGDIEKTRNAAIISALFPVVGNTLSAFSRGTGNFIKKSGEKVQMSVIKPSINDIRDGFKIENVNKYNLGGPLQTTLAKTNQKINELGQKLKEGLKGSVVPVNVNDVYETVAKSLSGSKLENFGNNSAIKRVLENLKIELEDVAGQNGLVDLVEAQLIKRGAGTKGAWVYGSADPDATAVERVYTAFYKQMKEAIEKAADKSGFKAVKEINRQISDLIPISNAVLRRIPIEQRNNALSLSEGLMVLGSLFDFKALAVLGASKLSKSGKFGEFLSRVGSKIKDARPSSPVGKRLLKD